MEKYQLVVKTIPSISDLAKGIVKISDLRDLDFNDLLFRSHVLPNYTLLNKNINNKTIMVTGAGGSIGDELCYQILKLKPRAILLLEISEHALYRINEKLEKKLQFLEGKENITIVPLLASVCDENRMGDIMKTWKPDTIYHVAAYKHVPLVEHNLIEGIKNNIFGTLTVAKLATQIGVSSFVLVSTDKAVRPTNIMGASKRVAELCLQGLQSVQETQKYKEVNITSSRRGLASFKKTKFCMVRFGNVMGSSGSVIPRFRKQIKDGGPVTLTHKDIIRYFMTVQEAAELVIQAGAMAKGGEVFVLDMGKPIKIKNLARRMIELSGLSVRDKKNPEGDIEIKITGLRPGEKLFEELLIEEVSEPTENPKIKKAKEIFIPWDELQIELNKLKKLVNKNDVKKIKQLLEDLKVGYVSNKETVDWTFTKKIQLGYNRDNLDISNF